MSSPDADAAGGVGANVATQLSDSPLRYMPTGVTVLTLTDAWAQLDGTGLDILEAQAILKVRVWLCPAFRANTCVAHMTPLCALLD